MNHYADINYAPISDLLRQDGINTDNQLMAYSDLSWKYFPDTGISTGSHIIFYQGGTIDHVTHFTRSVAQ